MNMKIISANNKGIGEGMDFVESGLKNYQLKSRTIYQALLAVEESLVKLAAHTANGQEIQISIIKRLDTISIRLTAPGEEFDLAENAEFGVQLELDDVDYDTEMALRSMIIRSMKDRLKYKHKNQRNTILISVKKSEKKSLYMTLGALVLSVICGFAMKEILPETWILGLDGYVMTPVKTMFLNALKMVVGPVVFFSIVSCISNFGNITEFGKIGAKIMGMYLFTTFVAVAVGLGVFFLFQPGTTELLNSVEMSASAAQGTEISILDTIINIIPSNIVKPFLDADMLQIIFIAVLCGISVGMIGDYSKHLKDFFEVCNTLFLQITTLIIKVIPLAIFCSMTSLILKTGMDTLAALLGLMGTIIVGMAGMITFYSLMIALIARINPLTFLRKYAPTMLTTFSLSSSSAAMPINMKTCREDLGISPRICSFSIPLGATVNMDGSCVYMAVTALFLAKVYGITLSGNEMFAMIFAIIVLSIGAPGIPGAAFVCLSVLLVQIGIPVESLGLIMGIDSIISMFRAASNTTGDVAVSLIVAKTEKLLNMEIYNR